MHTTLKSISATLPPESPSLLSEIINWRKEHPKSIVVLDDDPTGCQTVHNVPVLTNWSVASIQNEFRNNTPLFFILTNSRSFPEEEAVALNKVIAINIKLASQLSEKEFTIISRSDSTLRGHYPAETNALKKILNLEDAIEIIVPAFFEGGRYTANGLHYVEENGELVPAALTPFARDFNFGYSHSQLNKWIEEKTKGKVQAANVKNISIEQIRLSSVEQLTTFFINLQNRSVCTIDALAHSDIEKIALALHKAEKAGNKFLFRTAATFVKGYGGITEKPLLSTKELNIEKSKPGIIVVGSYVPKTSTQLNYLIQQNLSLVCIEIDIEKLLSENAEEEIIACTQTLEKELEENHVLLYTSRKLILGDSRRAQLINGQKISDGLVKIIRRIKKEPGYILAKGGITSSEIATKGLGITKANVKGQILAGVPVWEACKQSLFPGLTYVIFPGNVGDETSLYQACIKLFENEPI
ncbi:four-carbon acid sugar kinase family protein [Chondrinema litorale]|uniref:four-carbon acid sugar kinase family protein n=1 Tax=Chondrinema litorale TaxID=2994555 RepID=UPI0025438428|nr:four-carbon acid sugar kinase family protein [Chondrinema litorale]UZR97008.1 hypothetical protein OQ292_23195 [Chondrinema litorale]